LVWILTVVKFAFWSSSFLSSSPNFSIFMNSILIFSNCINESNSRFSNFTFIISKSKKLTWICDQHW
jgi:hypothetical protein